VELISVDDDGHGVIIHVNKVAADFGDLIEQFDRDPYRGVDLSEAAPQEVTAKIVAGSSGGELCVAMATRAAEVLRRYPPLPSDTFARIDTHITSFGFEWPESAALEVRRIATEIVVSAITEDAQRLQLASNKVMVFDDAMLALCTVKGVFLIACALIAVAKSAASSTGASSG
jgi:hypothetical protein